MKAYVGADIWFHEFVTSTVDGNECLGSRACALASENVLPVQF